VNDGLSIVKTLKMRESLPTGVRAYRVVFALLLFLLIYDGAIRKWIVPGAEQIIFIAKDVLLTATLGYWAITRRAKATARLHPGVRVVFTLYACWVVLQVFNINLPNWAVGIWGLKSHLLYAGIVILLPLAYPRLDELIKVLSKIYPWLVIPVCTLAFVQLLAPADSFLNQQVREDGAGTSYFGDASYVRVTGTFSYISGMAAFVQCAALLGVALYLGKVRSRLFLVALGFPLAALPVTGSRSVVATVVGGIGLMLAAAWVARIIGPRTLIKALLLLVGLGVVGFYSQDVAWEALVQRARGASGDEYRAITAFTNAFLFMDIAGLTGFGTGAANFGAVALSGSVVPFSWLPMGSAFEEESGRIVLEIGIVGWLLSVCLRLGLLIWATSLALRSKTSVGRWVGVLALPVMALGVQNGSGVFAVPLAAVYYWFCVALMAMARYEERQAKIPRFERVHAGWPGVGLG
jgi:hypothetical protein